jgi:arylsulfatase
MGKKDYHLTTDLADRAIDNITSHVSIYPDQPFFLFWAPSAMHSPHQVPQRYIDMHKGKFDMGWDKARHDVPVSEKLSHENHTPTIPPRRRRSAAALGILMA